jgi:hypothetical protein
MANVKDAARDFAGYIREIVREIERHKWLESEKAGHDIGGNRAAVDWLERYYDQWKRGRGYA